MFGDLVLESDVVESVRLVYARADGPATCVLEGPFTRPHVAPSGRRRWFVVDCAICALETCIVGRSWRVGNEISSHLPPSFADKMQMSVPSCGREYQVLV
jgi:hypothetical protein